MINSLLTDDWQQLFVNFRCLVVGFSGGLDSTVLLHCLANQPALIDKLQAVHVNHGLSVNATAWQIHCQQFCDSVGVPLSIRQVAVESSANIEEHARTARYQVFAELLAEIDGLLLAHHCDDQAETLLLQLFRGAGINGLAAMPSVKAFASGALVRPFLQHSRQRLEAYAHQHQLTWVDDESNQNPAFSRNYLRHHIMPLVQDKWPGVVSNLVRSASHCQQAKINLEALANIDCEDLNQRQTSLAISPLKKLSHARLANVLRVWLDNNDVRLPSVKLLNRIINEVIFARLDASPVVQWGNYVVRRYQQALSVQHNETPPCLTACIEWPTFPAPLPLDGDGEGEHYLCASACENGLRVPAGCHVQIRYRQGGELFYWRKQTKQLKKLFQQWRVPPWQRDLIPLLYIDNDLAAVVGFAISDYYFSTKYDVDSGQDSMKTHLCYLVQEKGATLP